MTKPTRRDHRDPDQTEINRASFLDKEDELRDRE
jgi:hypothetical protein